jgi:bifunctional non-homologous end joining protein LigD
MPVGSSPPLIRPMLATLGDLPEPPGWGYEFKWDGVRAIIYVESGRVRLLSRNDRDVSASIRSWLRWRGNSRGGDWCSTGRS